MKRITPRRLALALGWLLTPFAAWAVSFLGGWLGAVAGGGTSSDLGGAWWLSGGALAGAVIGAVAWVVLLRLVGRTLTRRSEAL